MVWIPSKAMMISRKLAKWKIKTLIAIIPSPATWNHGETGARTHAPSSCQTGIRFKRFRKKPIEAASRNTGFCVALKSTHAAVAPIVPAIGPAIPIWACFRASVGCWRWKIAAPRKGMKIGAVACMPWRLISRTCPISWTKIMTTRATANHPPYTSE